MPEPHRLRLGVEEAERHLAYTGDDGGPQQDAAEHFVQSPERPSLTAEHPHRFGIAELLRHDSSSAFLKNIRFTC
ncbi:hypothetical protein Aph01nite_26500 [Acrocarpospora phusangensis]|uniref:Uncharacterized protein n=1 Tax=Acrocarpospora phusangensis TaxID=1070424 RepID=A0A919QD16_9ACTN|nr:hypothetical protein Aph01nite_26500 [Acrocarpospora phusangensis]